MRSKLVIYAILSFSLSMATQASPPSVAVDIAPVHSLVSQVMEGVDKPNLLIPAEASPHHYTLRPSEAKALANANIVFWVGEGLTPWLEKAMKNLAGSAQKVEMLAIEGTTTLAYREGATFESHDHGDQEEPHKDEHHKEKKSHKAAHGGDHSFEWAGAFELSPGEYVWTFAKVNGKYADPKMKMVMLASDSSAEEAIKVLEETAEKLITSGRAIEQTHGKALTPNDSDSYQLVFDSNRNQTEYRIVIKKKGIYTFFTEHMPFEFEADEHILKNTARQDIEPIAQVPDAGHHHHHHGGVDPHAWLDPENAKIWIEFIANTLSKQNPENASTYRSNADKAIASLESLVQSTQAKIDQLGQPKFIVFHDAYQYFEKRFGISAAGSISLGDAEDPSPARIKEIQDTVKKLGVGCVFTEPQYNPGLVKNVFAGTKISTIGVMDPLGANLTTGSSHYQELIEGMLRSISQCQ